MGEISGNVATTRRREFAVRVTIIGAPIGIGAEIAGTELGPDAIRGAHPWAASARPLSAPIPMNSEQEEGLAWYLRSLDHEVKDEGNLPVCAGLTSDPKSATFKHHEVLLPHLDRLAKAVQKVATDSVTVILGGDHSISLGSVPGVVAARGPVGILWIDAHADFNTHETTPSGNIHGMSLAGLTGLNIGDKRYSNILGTAPQVDPARVVVLGARCLDRYPDGPDERKLLERQGVTVYTMREIDTLGIKSAITDALAIATAGGAALHVSFDIDVVDPSAAPGTGTPVAGGLTVREARLIMEMIADSGKLVSLDMVEVNPCIDERGRTSQLAAELICAALGHRLYQKAPTSAQKVPVGVQQMATSAE